MDKKLKDCIGNKVLIRAFSSTKGSIFEITIIELSPDGLYAKLLNTFNSDYWVEIASWEREYKIVSILEEKYDRNRQMQKSSENS